MKLSSVALAVLFCAGSFPAYGQFPDPDYVLDLTDAEGVAGGTAEVSVILDDPNGYPIAGWSWSVCQDNTNILIQSVEDAPIVAAFNGGNGPDFNTVQCLGPDGWAIGVVIDFFGMEMLPPAPLQELHIATYALQMDGETLVEFCETNCNPPVEIVLVTPGGVALTPTTDEGLVTVGAQGPEFARGDVDADGNVSPLVDALFVLAYQFVPGSPALPCDDAADFDDSGAVSGLVDGLGLLNWGFVPGSPPPSSPFPGCGTDPTESDPLGCALPPCP